MFKQRYLLGIGLLILVQCNSPKEKMIDLDPNYDRFQNLISLANCSGPNSKYTTEVHSTKDDYTYFKQDFGKENRIFEAVILNEKNGFILNEQGQKNDTLPKEAIAIIKGHEFHKIHMFPDAYFNNLVYQANESYQSLECERYEGMDKLNNKAILYYNRSEKSIVGIKTLNPNDASEQIEIIYQEWMESEFGRLVKKLEIVQGGKDKYHFDFENVSINDSAFEKKSGV